MFEREPNIDIVFRNGLKNLEVLPPSGVWDNIPPMAVKRPRTRVIGAVAAGAAALLSLSLIATWYVRHNTAPVILSEAVQPAGEAKVIPIDIAAARVINRDRGTADGASAGSETLPGAAGTASIASGLPEAAGEISSMVSLPLAGLYSSSPLTLLNADGAKSRLALSGRSSLEAVPLFADPATIIPVHQGSVSRWLLLPVPSSVGSAGKATVRSSPLMAEEITIVRSASSPERNAPLQPGERATAGRLRFLVGASLAPSMGLSHAGDNERMAELLGSEKSMPAFSAGVSLGYRISDRLTIQSGIAMASMSQTINDVRVYAGLTDYYAVKSGYLYSVETASGVIRAGNTDLYLTDSRERVTTLIHDNVADPSKYNLTHIGSDIQQTFRFLEVPLILRYKLLDRKVGLNLSGGVAYGVLIENEAFTGEGHDMVRVGHTEGINQGNISSQIGFGMEYSISKKISFNVEPQFRYYITPLSNIAGELYKPYSVGLFSGLYYKF